MKILKFKEVKRLENLYSWAQFYQNSEKLAVERYPRFFMNEKGEEYRGYGKKVMYIPYSDKLRYDKAQEQIKEIMED